MIETKRAPVVPDEDGAFSARVYVVEGPPDADGDIILRGAIEDGARVVVSAGQHDVLTDNAEPAGEARLYHGGNAVVAIGYAFDTARGRLLRAKIRAPRTEWSVGFTIISSRPPTRDERERHPATRRVIVKWRVTEISPVLVGACGPACMTLVSKGATCAGPCDVGADACCSACTAGETCAATREAVLREAARFEKTRARLTMRKFSETHEAIDHDAAILAAHELAPADVPDDVRAAAEEAVELASKILGGPSPRIRWFDPIAIDEVKAYGMTFIGESEVWVAARSDHDAVYRTACHETFHHARGADERAAKQFGDALSLLRGADVHVGPRKRFEGEALTVHAIPGLFSPERRRVGAVDEGALVIENGTMFEREEGAWRRIAALV